jgi:hypothetical protein
MFSKSRNGGRVWSLNMSTISSICVGSKDLMVDESRPQSPSSRCAGQHRASRGT